MHIKMNSGLYLVFATFFALSDCVWLDDNGGYRGLIMAVDSSVEIDDCPLFQSKIENLVTAFSNQLWEATDEQLYVASIDVVISRYVALSCNYSILNDGRLTWAGADIKLVEGWQTTQKWSPKRSVGVGVQQPLGCGRPGDFITIDYSILSSLNNPGEDDQPQRADTAEMTDSQKNATTIRSIGRSLVAAWAKYRWGVFEETPFDEKLSVVEDVNNLTNARCPDDAQLCENVTESHAEMSIMADVVANASFCTATTHDSLVANPHNLACMGKSTWEVMKQHPDFKFNQESPLESIISSGTTGTNQGIVPVLLDPIIGVISSPRDLSPEVQKDEENHGILKVRNTRDLSISSRSEPLIQSENDALALREGNKNTDLREDEGDSITSVHQNYSIPSKNVGIDKLVDSSFIGGLPTMDKSVGFSNVNNTDSGLEPPNRDAFSSETLSHNNASVFASFLPSMLPPSNSNMSYNHSVTWIGSQDANGTSTSARRILQPSAPRRGPPPATTRLVSYQTKAVVVALDLSSSSVSQASVEWLRGGLLRWMFGIGEDISVGVLASYSDTSFPLLGPLPPSHISERHLEEQMALLPYQHEVDDDVYGGKFCLSCVIREAEKMFVNAGLSVEAGVLILTMCQPQLSTSQLDLAASSPMTIQTVTMCPNAPLYVEKLAAPDGSWALSSVNMGTGLTAEVQLAHLLTEICRETLLWPMNSRLQNVHDEDKLLRKEDFESVGAFQRVKGTIKMSRSKKPRLFIISSSSPAKVVELWSGKKRLSLHRDTTRRYWALLDDNISTFSYSLKFLSTSLELPLTLATGVYERSEENDVHVRLRSNTRRYRPGNGNNPYLTVWAEVTNDGKPVLDADVTISVTYLSGHSPSTYSLMLLDDGSTEPDIRKGDGIYSRYLTWTPGTGRYILTARALMMSSSYSIKNGQMMKDHTSQFEASSSSLSLVVEMVPGGDFFPPSRITDLSVTSMKNSLVNITWSAPGGDLDQGSAWKYQLKMYTESAALTQERFGSSGIDVYCLQGEEKAPTPAPALFGTPQYCLTSIPFSNLQWFFAMRAIDGANNTGKISNIVSAFVYEATTKSLAKQSSLQEDIVETVIMSTYDPEVTSASDEDSNWYIFGIALVAAILLVMLSIVVFACIFCCRKTKINKDNKDPERPIYKIYVNNAYIQEEDGEIKVVNKEKSLDEKEKTQQWINSLDKYESGDAQREENQADISAETIDSNRTSGNGSKPVRFGVLTNGSIMREVPLSSSSSSSSSKPSDEALPDNFKYKDLSETISNSTSDGAAGSTSSAATEISTADTLKEKDHVIIPYKVPYHNSSYESTYQPLGIPTLPGPTVVSIHSNFHDGYNSDEDGGFRSRSVPGPGTREHLPSQFCSFRYLPAPQDTHVLPKKQFVGYPPNFSTVTRATNTPIPLPHGTVRSVKKRRHISFV